MAVGSQQVTVGASTPVVLASAPAGTYPGYVGSVLIYPDASIDVYLGGSNVTASNGYKVLHGTTPVPAIPLVAGDVLYGLAASSTATVGVLVV